METYFFHIEANESRFSGQGRTCFAAAVAAVGPERAARIARNTVQTPYVNRGVPVARKENGVSRFIARNGMGVATVTRIVGAG